MNRKIDSRILLKTFSAFALLSLAPLFCVVLAEEESAKPAENERMCKVVEAHADSPESQKVIGVLQSMAEALTKGDMELYQTFLDDGCTTFDEGSKRLIVGKQAVMENMVLREGKNKDAKDHPPMVFTIDHPYAQVHGNTAVVTFKAIRQTLGKHPHTDACNATDIFVKNGDKWQRLHFRGHWKKVSS